MAQVKLLKIGADGIPTEMDVNNDQITLGSFSTSGGQTLSSTGLNLNSTAITGLTNISVVSPSTNTINQTAGAVTIDNLMAKDRDNLMGSSSSVLFPVITNSAGSVDAFQLPALAGPPSATPTSTGEGFVVWDSTNDDLYIWNGTSWDNQNTVKDAERTTTVYTAGAGGITGGQLVYISGADTVLPALATAAPLANVIGFATNTVSAGSPVNVSSAGAVSGFTGLTAGSRYYLSAATAGAISTTVPSAQGQYIVQAGYAKNTTTMQVVVEELGRRFV